MPRGRRRAALAVAGVAAAASVARAAGEIVSAAPQLADLSHLQPEDSVEELVFTSETSSGVLARCHHVPEGHGASCEHVDAASVENVEVCGHMMWSILDRGGNSINYMPGFCQVLHCPGTGELEESVPYRRVDPRLSHMVTYSLLCARTSASAFLRAKDGPKGTDIDKSADYWTTSARFKHDLRTFFKQRQEARNWTAVELGSYRGYTTRVLSEIFRLVISVDQSSTFLANSRKYNEDRNNIVFLNLHSQHDGLRSLRQQDVQVAFIDAEHTYEEVKRDVRDVLETFGRTLEFVVFDDYGTDEGVLKAVQEHIQGGSLEIVGGFGNRPPWKYHGRVISDWEGVVCKVLRPSFPSTPEDPAERLVDPRMLVPRSYAWYTDNLWQYDEVLSFTADGGVSTSRGSGKWRIDKGSDRGVWLDWPARRPPSLGGEAADGSIPMESWYVQFDEDHDKFAAAQMGQTSTNAVAFARDVVESVFRRMFVAATMDFCNSANECARRG